MSSSHLSTRSKASVSGSSSVNHSESQHKGNDTNPANWPELFGDYLFRVALVHLKSRDDAEEIVQETFISGIRGLGSFQGRSTIKTWLRSILKNKLIDHFRKSSRTEHQAFDEEEFHERNLFFNSLGIWNRYVSNWGSNPEKLLEGKEFEKVFRSCLDKLPEKQKQIFLLATFQGVEREDICKELTLSSSNYWVIMHRVRMLLRECLQTNWILPQGKK